MRDNLGDEARIKHILDAITEVQSYTKDIRLKILAKNSMMKFAVIKQLEIIGEAANHVSEKLKENYSEIKWREIIGLRNILIHEYFGVDEKYSVGNYYKGYAKTKESGYKNLA